MNVLAIDPGSKLGWACNVGKLRWGTERFEAGKTPGARWVAFREWFEAQPRVDLVIYERQIGWSPAVRRSSEIGFSFTSRIDEWCHVYGVRCESINIQTIKSFAVPPPPKRKKGDPKLDRSTDALHRMASERMRGVLNAPLTEHEAIALWLYWYAVTRF